MESEVWQRQLALSEQFVLLLFCAVNHPSWSVRDLHEASKIYWISNSRPKVVPGHQEDGLEKTPGEELSGVSIISWK